MPVNLRTIAGIRAANKKSQTDMAKALGIARESYRNKETGKTEFTASELGTMAQKFNVTPSRFYEEL